MMLERVRILLSRLSLLVHLLAEIRVGLRLALLRRAGREAEADALVQRSVTGLAHGVLRRLRCRLQVEGLEHVPDGQAFVVYANHQSMWDPAVLVAGLDRALGFVVKRELLWIPGLSYWMRQIHCRFIDRRDISGSARALHELAAELKRRGQGFIIFPEGTRSRHPEREVQPFKRGALRLAADQGLPVLPVVLDGSWLVDQPRWRAATRRGGRLVRLRILPLRRCESGSAPERRAFMDDLHETIRSNREAIRVHWPAD